MVGASCDEELLPLWAPARFRAAKEELDPCLVLQGPAGGGKGRGMGAWLPRSVTSGPPSGLEAECDLSHPLPVWTSTGSFPGERQGLHSPRGVRSRPSGDPGG